eukprot:260334-Prorocentrum_minimum.AAC.1
MELGMALNGFSYTVEHNWKNDPREAAFVPEMFDTAVIMYPNGRHYVTVQWASPPEGSAWDQVIIT